MIHRSSDAVVRLFSIHSIPQTRRSLPSCLPSHACCHLRCPLAGHQTLDFMLLRDRAAVGDFGGGAVDTNNIDTLVLTLTELCVLGFMIKKCMERGDGFVAGSEFNSWKSCFIKLVRHKFDKQHRDYGFYHVKRLINEAGDQGALYKDLCAIINHPLKMDNFKQVNRYAMTFVQKHFPDVYKRQQDMIAAVTQHIEDYKPDLLAERLSPPVHTTLKLLQSA